MQFTKPLVSLVLDLLALITPKFAIAIKATSFIIITLKVIWLLILRFKPFVEQFIVVKEFEL